MIKNPVFMKHLKRAFTVILASVVMITLSGCAESSDKNPTGGLEINNVYATNGKYSVTVGDLYEELRHNSLGFLSQRIEEVTFEDYLEKVDSEDGDHQQLVAEYILNDIHGTYDEDELSDLSAYTKEYNIYTYVDTMLMEGYIVTYNELNYYTIEQIQGSDAFDVLWDEYAIDVAKYLYAYDVLTEEIAEHNDEAADDDDLDVYFTDAEIANYFDTNYGYEGDVDAIIIRFINQDESNAVLKKFGIKSYNGSWYLIQPPKDEYGYTDYTKWKDESDYNTYYDEYSITQSSSSSSDVPIESLGNDTTILKMFIEIYNFIYTYRTTLTYDGRTTSVTSPVTGDSISNTNYLYYYTLMMNIIESDRTTSNPQTFDDLHGNLLNRDSNNITFTKEKLDTYSTSLTTYLHDSLATTPEIDDDGKEESFIQYTASSRSYNNNYYLMFKLSDAEEKEFYTIEEDTDGEEYYVFDETLLANDFNVDSNETLYDQILLDMFNDELTDAYISNKASARGDFITVEIYDSMLELSYSLANPDYTGTKGFDNDLIAVITFKDTDNKVERATNITVVETYEFLEPIYGTQTSMYLLFDKYVVETSYYEDIVSEEDYYDTYKENVYLTLNYFTNDYYSSYGYPASIGKYNFMKSFYKTAVVDEAIEYLTVQEAKRQFFLDLDDDFYNQMSNYTNQAYDNYYSLSLNTITVYVDMDEDGIPDADWFDTDDTDATASQGWDGVWYGTDSGDNADYVLTSNEKKQLANNLIADIVTYVKKSTDSLTTSFEAVVSEYNSSIRIEPNSTDFEFAGSIEAKWAQYRKHGLYISTTSLGEFSDTITGLDTDMQSLVQGLYTDETSEIIFNNSFSGSYLIEDEYLLNDDGYNLLLVTGGNGKTEIDFENEDQDIYKNVPIRIGDTYKIYEDLTSYEATASDVQIEVYCREYFSNGGSTSLSTSATTFLDTYLTGALTKYNSEIVQLMIIVNTLGTVTSAENAIFNEGLSDYISYMQRVSDGYLLTTSEDYATYSYVGFWDYINTIGGDN